MAKSDAHQATSDAGAEPSTQDPVGGTPEGRRVIDLLWSPPGPAGRGPRQKMTLDQVVEAAVGLADADGFEALSMRGLARHLGVGAMSLYTYVPGRDELFELMVDRAYGDRARPDVSLPWRERYAGHAREALAMYRRHPWLIHANLWRLPLGPNVLDVSEDQLAIGHVAGLPYARAVRVSSLLESTVFGLARGEVADRVEAARTGVSYDGYWEARSGFWTSHFDAQRFPMMFATWEAGAYDVEESPDDGLEFALGLLLDSVERLAAAGDPPPPAASARP